MSSKQSADSGDTPEDVTRDSQEEYIFGPPFFLSRLSSFVRDACPDPEEHLPSVEVHLNDGEVLQLCHIIGIAPHWVALAVFDGESDGHTHAPMRTEIVPYMAVMRVTIRPVRRESSHPGFDAHVHVSHYADHGHVAEDALRGAMR